MFDLVGACRNRCPEASGRFRAILRRCWLTILFVLSVGALAGVARADIIDRNLGIHDPSRMVFDSGRWWIFGTSNDGIDVLWSTDRVRWNRGAAIFRGRGTSYWAPDLLSTPINGKWYLFYSVSTFGSRVSRIGLAETTSIGGGNWVDRGTVINSSNSTPYNAIDAAPFLDRNNQLWMTFGSFFGGLYIQQLNLSNPTQRIGNPIHIAGGGSRAVEAPYLEFHNGWYYLIFNVDRCCLGDDSTYKIFMGRSRSITGPYVDKTNVDLRSGGGSMLISGSGDEIGPGHFGLVFTGGIDWFTYHVYPPGIPRGPARLAQRQLLWDDWPRALFPSPISDGIYRIRGSQSNLGLAVRNESRNPAAEAHIEQSLLNGRQSLRWRFIRTADGSYNIRNEGTGFYLDLANGNRAGGDFVRQWWPVNLANNEAQKWRVIALAGGLYEIQSMHSGKALDVQNFSTSPGGLIMQWDWLNGSNQKFFIERVN